jgi:hypothetical protein
MDYNSGNVFQPNAALNENTSTLSVHHRWLGILTAT